MHGSHGWVALVIAGRVDVVDFGTDVSWQFPKSKWVQSFSVSGLSNLLSIIHVMRRAPLLKVTNHVHDPQQTDHFPAGASQPSNGRRGGQLSANSHKISPCPSQPTDRQPAHRQTTRSQVSFSRRQKAYATTTAIMSHESVWNSRPRNYGKGARSWYGLPPNPPVLEPPRSTEGDAIGGGREHRTLERGQRE